MDSIILNVAVKQFLQTLHPEVLAAWQRPFLRGLAQQVKSQLPDLWDEFKEYVQKAYRPDFWVELLKE